MARMKIYYLEQGDTRVYTCIYIYISVYFFVIIRHKYVRRKVISFLFGILLGFISRLMNNNFLRGLSCYFMKMSESRYARTLCVQGNFLRFARSHRIFCWSASISILVYRSVSQQRYRVSLINEQGKKAQANNSKTPRSAFQITYRVHLKHIISCWNMLILVNKSMSIEISSNG